MAKLSYMLEMIQSYIKVKGDKEVTSIGTCNGSEKEFTINVCDIYDGPAGTNPFTGRDEIVLTKNGKSDNKPLTVRDIVENGARPEGTYFQSAKPSVSMQAFFRLHDNLRKDTGKSTETKLAIAWGALSVMTSSGEIGINVAKALWTDLAMDLMGLE